MVRTAFWCGATFLEVPLVGVQPDGVEEHADRVRDATVVELEPRAGARGPHLELVVVPLGLRAVPAVQLDAGEEAALPPDDEHVLVLWRPGPCRGAELEPVRRIRLGVHALEDPGRRIGVELGVLLTGRRWAHEPVLELEVRAVRQTPTPDRRERMRPPRVHTGMFETAAADQVRRRRRGWGLVVGGGVLRGGRGGGGGGAGGGGGGGWAAPPRPEPPPPKTASTNTRSPTEGTRGRTRTRATV